MAVPADRSYLDVGDIQDKTAATDRYDIPGPTVENILNVRAAPIPTVALASAPAY